MLMSAEVKGFLTAFTYFEGIWAFLPPFPSVSRPKKVHTE